jgi:hypothetical protein
MTDPKPMEPLSEDELRLLRLRHRRQGVEDPGYYCHACYDGDPAPLEEDVGEWPCYTARLLAERDALRERVRVLEAAAATLLEGFDKAVFVRNPDMDADSAWAIKLLPYLRALAALDAKEKP